jgi:hypothetical protein
MGLYRTPKSSGILQHTMRLRKSHCPGAFDVATRDWEMNARTYVQRRTGAVLAYPPFICDC